jgi:hypothetical protein
MMPLIVNESSKLARMLACNITSPQETHGPGWVELAWAGVLSCPS